MGSDVQRRLEQAWRIRIVAGQLAEYPHLLLDQRRLVAVGKHRVEVDHLGGEMRCGDQRRQLAGGIAVGQRQAGVNLGELRLAGSAAQAILEQGSNRRDALDHQHSRAEAGEHEGVATQARGGIDDRRLSGLAKPAGLGHQLAAAAAEAAPMAGLAAHEIDLERFAVSAFIAGQYQYPGLAHQPQPGTLLGLPSQAIAGGEGLEALAADHHPTAVGHRVQRLFCHAT